MNMEEKKLTVAKDQDGGGGGQTILPTGDLAYWCNKASTVESCISSGSNSWHHIDTWCIQTFFQFAKLGESMASALHIQDVGRKFDIPDVDDLNQHPWRKEPEQTKGLLNTSSTLGNDRESPSTLDNYTLLIDPANFVH